MEFFKEATREQSVQAMENTEQVHQQKTLIEKSKRVPLDTLASLWTPFYTQLLAEAILYSNAKPQFFNVIKINYTDIINFPNKKVKGVIFFHITHTYSSYRNSGPGPF